MKWTKQVTLQCWCKSIFSELGRLVFSCALACAKRWQQRTTGKEIWLSMRKKNLVLKKSSVRPLVNSKTTHPPYIHRNARWGWWFCNWLVQLHTLDHSTSRGAQRSFCRKKFVEKKIGLWYRSRITCKSNLRYVSRLIPKPLSRACKIGESRITNN